jgi:hypothetical protein
MRKPYSGAARLTRLPRQPRAGNSMNEQELRAQIDFTHGEALSA